MTLLNILRTPYKYGNVELTDGDLFGLWETIAREYSYKSLLAIQDNISDMITNQVSGILKERLMRLWEFANYRLQLMRKNA